MFDHLIDGCNCPGKRCPDCKQVKCHSAFAHNRRQEDGLQVYCRECYSIRQATFRQNNLDHVRESRRVRARKYREEANKLKAANLEQAIKMTTFDHVIDTCACSGKKCPSCEQVKCHEAFNRSSSAKSGLQVYCQACQNAKSMAHYRNNLERERMRSRTRSRAEYQSVWRQSNAEHLRELNREYREANHDRLKAYRGANRDRFLERQRSYQRSHREQHTLYEAIRRARKVQSGGSFTQQEWRDLCAYYKDTCLCCGRQEPDVELTIDHVVPLAKGGSNSLDNLQPLCRSCNASKRTKVIDYRLEWKS